MGNEHGRKRRGVRLLLLGLVCLLSVQLTGLTCLEDLSRVRSHLSEVVSLYDDGLDNTEFDVDACPCHSSIAYAVKLSFAIIIPDDRAPLNTPNTHLEPIATSLFHPPVSL